jgi:hypothetical protein
MNINSKVYFKNKSYKKRRKMSDDDMKKFQSIFDKWYTKNKIGVRLTGFDLQLYNVFKNNVEYLKKQKSLLDNNKSKIDLMVWTQLNSNLSSYLEMNQQKIKTFEKKKEQKPGDVGIIIDNEKSFSEAAANYFKNKYKHFVYLNEDEFDPEIATLKWVWLFHTSGGPRVWLKKKDLIEKIKSNKSIGGLVIIIVRNVIRTDQRIASVWGLNLRDNKDFAFHIAFTRKKFHDTENNKYVIKKFEEYLNKINY